MTVESRSCAYWHKGAAKAIREQLIEQGRLPEDRVFLIDAELAPSEGKQVRVRLNLTGS
ncbi:MAG: hypothetical protein IPO99_18485 [Nitrospira sp.]|nr:hypothetical protein [Nitrospira sp.]